MNFIPLSDHILISPIYEKPKSFLELPEDVEKTCKSGTVLAIGPKVKFVKVNDIVLLPIFGAIEVEIEGEKLKLIHEEDILGILH